MFDLLLVDFLFTSIPWGSGGVHWNCVRLWQASVTVAVDRPFVLVLLREGSGSVRHVAQQWALHSTLLSTSEFKLESNFKLGEASVFL